MGDFNRNDRQRSDRRGSGRSRDFVRSDRRDFRSERNFDNPGRSRNFDRSDRPQLTMYTVICDKCGKECEVPFKPTSSKPVFCSDCFRKPDRSESRPRNDSSNDLKEINKKLDKILTILEASDIE